jgi:hypothetical protein
MRAGFYYISDQMYEKNGLIDERKKSGIFY